MICKNSFESLVGYLGSLASDSVSVLLDENINKYHLKKLIINYNPDYIFIDKNNNKNIKNYKFVFNFFDFDLIESQKKKSKNLHPNLKLLVSTSGSTGTSKFVKLSSKNIDCNTISISKYLKISTKDNAITTLPMSYVYGLSIINTHLYNGATVTLNRNSLVQKDFWTKLEKHKVTNFGGVPYIYSILDKINLNRFDLKYLKYTTQAGGKLHETIVKRILEKYKPLNIKLLIMYGAAEATARMSFLPWGKIKDKINSIGKPIAGGKFSIQDENSKIINAKNKVGELIYKGKNVCMGYSNNFQDLSKEDVNKDILRTGDLAYVDKDKYYYLVGRKDRYIKIYGLRINLQELEDIIFDYGYENMCLQEKENTINIYLKKKLNLEKFSKYLSNLTNIHISVFKINYIDEFPMNRNLKIIYK